MKSLEVGLESQQKIMKSQKINGNQRKSYEIFGSCVEIIEKPKKSQKIIRNYRKSYKINRNNLKLC